MSTERFNVVYRDYPEQVKLSDSRRVKYFEKGKGKLGKTREHLITQEVLIWKDKAAIIGGIKSSRSVLYDTRTNEWVVKNPKAAGTPKFMSINSQWLWESGAGNEHVRRKLKDELTAYFLPGIIRQLPERLTPGPGKYIQLEYIFFEDFKRKDLHTYQDYINHFYVRGKVFEDCLTKTQRIPDDHPQYLRGGYARFVDISEEADKERRLEIKIHFCRNTDRIQ